MASLELLDALSRGADTVTAVATVLGISHAEAARQLSAATASGLVGWEDDEAWRSARLAPAIGAIEASPEHSRP